MCLRPTALVALALFAGAALVSPKAQAFCGFYVSGADAKLFNNATQVVLMRDATTTVMSMQNDYQGPPADFAMVVPVPVVLQEENVKTLTRAVFGRIDSLAAPRLVEYWEQDPCRQLERMYKSKRSGVPMAAPMMAMADSAPEDLGVTIEAQFEVGEYQIVILSAKDSGGLDKWLKQEGYKIPAGAEPYLRPYVQQGSKFFVAKVDVKKVTFDGNRAVLSPLRFHFDTDEFKLPVRLGMMNSQGTQDLIVHILARDQRYEVANRPNAVIPTNFNLKEEAKGRFGEFYAALFDRVVLQSQGAVITEYAWDSSTCDPCPVPALRYDELLSLGLDVIEGQPLPAPEPPPLPPPAPKPLKTDAPTGDIVKDLMAPPTPRPVMKRRMRPPPIRRGNARGWVLTRLHARYDKDGLKDDLVFKAAPPIAGGRERYMGDDRTLPEQGSVPDGRNNFQGRYAIRHEWKGPMECEEPRRGIWGGPPGGGTPKPMAAKDTAMAPRGKLSLPAVVARGLTKELMAASPPKSDPPQVDPEKAEPEKVAPSKTQAAGEDDNCSTGIGTFARVLALLHRR